MRPIIFLRRGLTLLAMLVIVPAVLRAQTSEGPVEGPVDRLEILWEFDTGG